VARNLVHHRDLMVISNNLNVVDMLAGSPSIETIVAGGRVRAADRAVVGPLAVEAIRQFKVDFAIIGASAIDSDGALLDFDVAEVQVSQTIIRHARQVILVADGAKVGRPAPVRIGHFEDVDFFVTDRLDDAGLAAVCREAGVKVIETAS
jgi:DeoR family glycerol-3-phosphate regulon repressor